MKVLALSTILFMGANAAIAQNLHTVNAKVTGVSPMTHTVNESVPYQQCSNIQVPIYETRRTSSANAGNVLGGMILGGLVGKGATGDDSGAAVGAVIGGMLAAENHNSTTQVIVGYRQETQCQMQYRTSQREYVSGYNVFYSWNGLTGSTVTDTLYHVGDTIRIRVQLN